MIWLFDQEINHTINSCLYYNIDGIPYLPSSEVLVSSYIINVPNLKRYNVSQWIIKLDNLSTGLHNVSISIDLPPSINGFPATGGDGDAFTSVEFYVDNTAPNILISISKKHNLLHQRYPINV